MEPPILRRNVLTLVIQPGGRWRGRDMDGLVSMGAYMPLIFLSHDSAMMRWVWMPDFVCPVFEEEVYLTGTLSTIIELVDTEAALGPWSAHK
jgi:hypothetical protein